MTEFERSEKPLGTVAAKWILVGLGIVFCLWAIYQNLSTLLLLTLSFLLSYLLDPVITKLEMKGLSRTLSISLLLMIFLVALITMTMVLVPQITQQTKELFSKYQTISTPTVPVESASTDSLNAEAPERDFVKWFDQNINPVLHDLGLEAMDKEDLRGRIQTWFQWIDVHYPSWGQSVWGVFQSMFTGVANFIVGILSLILVPVFTFYLLRDYPLIRQSFSTILPPTWRVPVEDWIGELNQVVGGFIRGQFSIALILAMVNAIGLTLIGVPFGFLIGIIAGLANMVPYMSIVVGLFPAMFFSFLDQPDFWRLIWVLAIFCGAQMLEGLYLGPKIMGKEVGLHPVLIMLAIIVGGSLWGLVGIFLAVPFAAVLKVAAVRCHNAWMTRWTTVG